MKVIIIAAGGGTRLKPLTNTTPKPLIQICGKSIIEHNLENIYEDVSEIIITVGYLSEKIKEYFGDNYKNTPITYYEQGKEKGTAGAIKSVGRIDGDFIIMVGDQIFLKEDIKKIIDLKGYGGLVKQVDTPEKYGIFKENEKGFAEKVVEKPKEFVGDLANISFYKVNSEIFDFIECIELSERGELEITDAINLFIKKYDYKLFRGEFIDIGSPPDILTANSYFLERLSSSKIKGIVESGTNIKGNIILGQGSIIKSGVYIEGNCYIGKNTVVGPNSYIKGNTVIGDNCKVGNAVEIKNSSLGNNTNIAHLSYLGDSVVGNNVKLGGGFMVANLRHDNTNIKMPVKGVLTDTGLRKFGCVIGDNTKIGLNTSVYPGRVIENDSFTIPGEIVK